MSKRIALAMAAVMVLSGCRIVSQKELAALQSPVNPHLAQAGAIYHEQMVPQVMKSAVPLANLIAQIEQAKDFDTACQQLGYRAQPEFPCHFSTQVSGEITAINTQSRSGRLTLKLATGPIESVDVQIGPVYRGTVLRDSYRSLGYGDFNDQTLFGDFAKAINQASMAELAGFTPKVGDKITVYGVFTSWQLPAPPLLITPVRIQP
jgi:predicted lipoprotein